MYKIEAEEEEEVDARFRLYTRRFIFLNSSVNTFLKKHLRGDVHRWKGEEKKARNSIYAQYTYVRVRVCSSSFRFCRVFPSKTHRFLAPFNPLETFKPNFEYQKMR